MTLSPTHAEVEAVAALIALNEAPKRPLSCRLGFHRVVQFERLITCGRSACLKCGIVFNESMFGDFILSRSESTAVLRAHLKDHQNVG